MDGEASSGKAVLCSTEGLPSHARGRHWRDVLEKAFPCLAVDWLADRPIDARLESRPFADAQVTEIRNTPVRVTHTPRSPAPGNYQLVLHLAGSGWYDHNGRRVIQEPGDLLLLDTALPFVSIFNVDLRVVVWDLPRETLLPLLALPERAIALRIPGRQGLGAVLASYARTLASEASRFDTAAQRNLQLHLCSLTALVVGANRSVHDTRRIAYRAARTQQILAYVEAHFRDGRLNAARAARDLNMSRRWLHALFDETDTSFAAYVARRRVEECRRILEDPTQDHLSIAETAFRCGFNELSTFNRQFRAHHAMTPRDARGVRVSTNRRS